LKVNSVIPVLFLMFLFFACSTRPSYVLSESKMEKVLYDVYLAEAEISNNYLIFHSDSTRKQELLNSVLKKHKITEAVLDTSLAWYSGHLDKYFKINENIKKRFTEATERLKNQEEKMRILSENTDRLILPLEKERFLLRSSDLLNNAYTFTVDTTLSQQGGTYELQLNILGLSAPLRPVVTLCVQCLDTTIVKRDTISRDGPFVVSADIRQGAQTEKIYGSIYFPETYSGMTVFIQNFILSHSHPVPSQDLLVTQPAK